MFFSTTKQRRWELPRRIPNWKVGVSFRKILGFFAACENTENWTLFGQTLVKKQGGSVLGA